MEDLKVVGLEAPGEDRAARFLHTGRTGNRGGDRWDFPICRWPPGILEFKSHDGDIKLMSLLNILERNANAVWQPQLASTRQLLGDENIDAIVDRMCSVQDKNEYFAATRPREVPHAPPRDACRDLTSTSNFSFAQSATTHIVRDGVTKDARLRFSLTSLILTVLISRNVINIRDRPATEETNDSYLSGALSGTTPDVATDAIQGEFDTRRQLASERKAVDEQSSSPLIRFAKKEIDRGLRSRPMRNP